MVETAGPPEQRHELFEVVVAADSEGGIGRSGQIPWRLSGDMKHFRSLTAGEGRASDAPRNAVVMGRRTWESLPVKFRPLPGRHNVVVSRNPSLDVAEGAVRAGSLEGALRSVAVLRSRGALGRCFVIGGAQIYRLAFELPECRVVHLTRLDGSFDCDAFIEPLEVGFTLVERSAPHEEASIRYWFERWTRRPAP